MITVTAVLELAALRAGPVLTEIPSQDLILILC